MNSSGEGRTTTTKKRQRHQQQHPSAAARTTTFKKPPKRSPTQLQQRWFHVAVYGLVTFVIVLVVSTAFFQISWIHRQREHLAVDQIQQQQQQDLEQQQRPEQQAEREDLPRWIAEYVTWHREQRERFPGMDLFTDPDAPSVLVRTCLGLCGGLHDRLGQLPWDLYLAVRTNRVLLIAWQRPRELEHFLIPGPGGLDWTIPAPAAFGFDHIRRVRNVTSLFEGYDDDRPDDKFWDVDLDRAMDRAVSGDFRGRKVLRHRILGHLNEPLLERRLEREGYYRNDPHHKADELHTSPTFGRIFHLFFIPSPPIAEQLGRIQSELGLSGRPYTAVHCRVRHPKAHPVGRVVKGKNQNYPADKTGLPWMEGNPLRTFACQTAATALQCAVDAIHDQKRIGGDGREDDQNNNKIYFLSDSNDLVRHVVQELQDPTYLRNNQTGIYRPLLQQVQQSTTKAAASGATSSLSIVSRDVTLENAHIDRQKGRDPPAYYGTFLDLYLAVGAQCVVYGVGYYAAFAAKISGTPCAYLYAEEEWGTQTSKSARRCPHPGAMTTTTTT